MPYFYRQTHIAPSAGMTMPGSEHRPHAWSQELEPAHSFLKVAPSPWEFWCMREHLSYQVLKALQAAFTSNMRTPAPNVLNDWEGAPASWALRIIRASLVVVRFSQCRAFRRFLYACMVPTRPRLYLNISPGAASSFVICFPYMKLELRMGFLRKNVKFKIWVHFRFLFAKINKRTFIVFCRNLLLSTYIWLDSDCPFSVKNFQKAGAICSLVTFLRIEAFWMGTWTMNRQ